METIIGRFISDFITLIAESWYKMALVAGFIILITLALFGTNQDPILVWSLGFASLFFGIFEAESRQKQNTIEEINGQTFKVSVPVRVVTPHTVVFFALGCISALVLVARIIKLFTW